MGSKKMFTKLYKTIIDKLNEIFELCSVCKDKYKRYRYNQNNR